jgi:hypothetical protein
MAQTQETMILVANLQNPYSYVEVGRRKSRVPGNARQFATNINYDEVCGDNGSPEVRWSIAIEEVGANGQTFTLYVNS